MKGDFNIRYPWVSEYNRIEAYEWYEDYLETLFSGNGYTLKELEDLLADAETIIQHLLSECNVSKKDLYTSNDLYVVKVPHTNGKWLYYHDDEGLDICEYSIDKIRSESYLPLRSYMMFTQEQINYYALSECEKEQVF